MARFDVYRTPDGWLALDCQADTLSHLNTRFAVPLLPRTDAPLPAEYLNPILAIDGAEVVMVTQFAASVPIRDLRDRVGTLVAQEYAIGRALDMLVNGF